MSAVLLVLFSLQGFEERTLATLDEGTEIVQAVPAPDARAVAYSFRDGPHIRVALGGWRSKGYRRVFGLALSGDGKQAVYVAVDADENYFVCRNDSVLLELKGGWNHIGFPPLVSADGSTVVLAVANRGSGEGALAVNEALGKAYRGLVLFPAMSRDGRVKAFVWKREDERWHVVVDGKVEPACDYFTPPAVSEDGSRVAYAVQRDKQWTLHVGGTQSAVKAGYHRIFVSPTGKAHGFVMEDPDLPESEPKRFFVRMGERVSPERFSLIWPPVFSPDLRTWAYRAVRSQKEYVVVGERPYETPGIEGAPSFSPDGKRVGYCAVVGRSLVWKVIDIPR